MAPGRYGRVFGAVNIGSFRISAIIMAQDENGGMMVLGSSHRASRGIKRGYVTDMQAASQAIRDAVERAEATANTNLSGVWINCAGAGLVSRISTIEIGIGGRRIEDDDIEHLLHAARDHIQPDGRTVLHAQPTHYTLDGVHGVTQPRGLHAEMLGVDIHVMLADGAPVRNLIEAVQNVHLDVEGVVASPVAAAYACLSAEERELGVALVELGSDVSNVSVHAAGLLLGMQTIPYGSAALTEAIATSLGIRRSQAERLKCVFGSAIASPSDHRELIPVTSPIEEQDGKGGIDPVEPAQIKRAELVSVVTEQLGRLTGDIAKALKELGFSGQNAKQVVLTGGGADLAGIADYCQAALGRPVRIGKVPALRGLPETHATPGFTTLIGLCLYAAEDPTDIRSIRPGYQPTNSYSGGKLVHRVFQALREYF